MGINVVLQARIINFTLPLARTSQTNFAVMTVMLHDMFPAVFILYGCPVHRSDIKHSAAHIAIKSL